MKNAANPVNMLQFITQPAFLVKDGIIIQTNKAAKDRQINADTPVSDMIAFGKAEYDSFNSGKLYLELIVGPAWVSLCDGFHLFCLENNFSSPELRAFALAAQHLRAPLSNAVSGAEQILQREDLKGTDIQAQISEINKNLYQLIRSVCNMSDVSQLGTTKKANTELCSVGYKFGEIFEKATTLVKTAGRSVEFQNLTHELKCILDAQLIERAVLNLLSNALKFSPSNTVITAKLKHNRNRLTFSIENSIQDGYSGFYGNAFNRFLREPGIESGQFGIGLGMSIVSSAATAHNGTILMDLSKKGIVKTTISIPIQTSLDATAKTPIKLLDGYTGGIDSYLVELSDILPSYFYKNL